jgi:ubiquinone/menaquinone biosynthesis C-methylase UbiE
MKEQVHYSTWIRMNKIVTLWVLAVVFLGIGFGLFVTVWLALAFVPGLLFTYIALIVTLTHVQLSEPGGDYQNKIHELILARKIQTGETVDIGCGNGSLLIKSAKADRQSHHVGIDYWGNDWQYSLEQCQTNARLEGVNNVEFIKGTAARTGFADRRFSCVLSCLTFHEVRDESDKLNIIREALRIVKPGGYYAFLDLFEDQHFYPSLGDVRSTIEQSGCTITIDKSLSELMALPFPLNGKKALRYARLIAGIRSIA